MLVTCPGCESLVEFDDQAGNPPSNCPTCGNSLTNVDGDQTVTYQTANDSIGHFQLLDKLGSGAFGSVWKAKDTRLDRTVAVKIPNRSDLSEKEREVFLREARAAAQLHHPNIVSVNEIGTRDGKLFIVSEYVAGCNLREWLSGYQPGPRDTARLIATLADALHHAHEHGVIHRDLKPSNIMIDLENQPHIMDFGLAKRQDAEASMTVDGQIMGTPLYMSPEQASGHSRKADRRSDVYSLGVILFEMLTGEKPFRGEPRVVMSQIMNVGPPGPRSLKTSVPRDLETVCLKCLEKEPSRRYPDAQSLAGELRRFLDGQPILARPISQVARAWRLCRRWPVVSSLAALLVAAVTIGFAGISTQWYRANSEWVRAETNARNLAAEEARKSEYLYVAHINMIQQAWENGLTGRVRELLDRHLPQEGQRDLRTFEWHYFDARCREAMAAQSIDYGDKISSVAVSADGAFVALAGDDNRVQVWQLSPQRRTDVLDAHQSAVTQLEFSGNGDLLVTADRSQVIVWQKSGGTYSRLHVAETPQRPAFKISPDNNLVVISDSRSVSLFDSEKNGRTELVRQEQIADFCFFGGGKSLLIAGSDEAGGPVIDLWDIASRTKKRLLNHPGGNIWQMILAEDETRLLVSASDGCRVYRVTSDDGLQEVSSLAGFPRKLTGLVSLGSSRGFAAADATSLAVWNWDAPEPVGQVFDPEKFSGSLSASVHQSVLATTGTGNIVHLWDSETLLPLGSIRGHSNVVYGLEFLPEGRLVTVSRDNTAKIWSVLDARDSQQLPCGNEWLWSVAISPDSRTLATASADHRVYLWDLERGEDLTEMTGHQASVQFVRFSPDGIHLASSGHDKTIRIWDCKTRSLVRELTGHLGCVNSLDFSANGKQLVSGSNDGSVMLWDVDTGQPLKWVEVDPKQDVWAVAFSPTGNRVVFGGMNQTVSLWDFENSDQAQTVVELKENVTSLAWSPSGSIVSITSADGIITLWNCDTGEQVRQLVAHSADAMFTAFSPDNATLVSGGSDGTVQFWNMATLEPTMSFKLHPQHIHCVAFSTNGRKVATASWDGTSRILSCE